MPNTMINSDDEKRFTNFYNDTEKKRGKARFEQAFVVSSDDWKRVTGEMTKRNSEPAPSRNALQDEGQSRYFTAKLMFQRARARTRALPHAQLSQTRRSIDTKRTRSFARSLARCTRVRGASESRRET